MLDLRKWFIQNQPLWLTTALNLSTAEVPRGVQLDQDTNTGELAPAVGFTMDPYQNGVAVARPIVTTSFELTNANAVHIAGESVDVANECGLVLGISVEAAGLAATRHLSIVGIGHGAGGTSETTAVTFAYAEMGLTADDHVSWQRIAGDPSARIFLPPGWTVTCFSTDLAGGESVFLSSSVLRMPAGFKPF